MLQPAVCCVADDHNGLCVSADPHKQRQSAAWEGSKGHETHFCYASVLSISGGLVPSGVQERRVRGSMRRLSLTRVG